MLRFRVFGMLVGVERTPAGWATYWLGNEGKRRPAEFAVPDFVAEDELAQYLRDLFHESASPQHPDVVRLPHIETLTPSHAPAYRELMLEAYTLAADAFTSTAEERAAEPLAWWEKRIASAAGLSESFGVFTEGRLAGTVALEYTTKPKTRHSALVLGMYVRPSMRGQGAGRALMEAAVSAARARPGIEVLRLTVTEGNEPALRLYQSVGFRAWGTEPEAIRTPGGFRGKVHMIMSFGGPASAQEKGGAITGGQRAAASPQTGG